MSEQGERRSFWNRLFGGSRSSAREEKVLQYIIHRIEKGANLQEVVQEDYVRRNATSDEVKQICSNPRLVAAARESLGHDFSSGDLDPNQRSS
jgi:gamma-glutamyltranspeptidase